jgi:hypothetical protein
MSAEMPPELERHFHRPDSYIAPMRFDTDPSRIPMASSAHQARWIALAWLVKPTCDARSQRKVAFIRNTTKAVNTDRTAFEGFFDMTMLMHTHGPFERAPSSMTRQNTARAGAAATRLAGIKQFCIGALAVLAAGGALTAVIALKTAIHYWRFH